MCVSSSEYIKRDFNIKFHAPRKCIKRMNCGYSFYVRCDCGTELNIDSYYWNDFKLCPSCGTKMIEVDE